MVVELHETPASPFCRSVRTVAKILDVPLELNLVNVLEKQQHTAEYLDKNPFHKVPTLIDDGFQLYESRAIMKYLMGKYGRPDDSLYPSNDLRKKSIVDQMLDLDSGTLAPAVLNLMRPLLFRNQEGSAEDIDKVKDILKSFDAILSKQRYVAGNDLTLADIAIRATVSLLEALESPTHNYFSEVPALKEWSERTAKEIPNYGEINDEHTKLLMGLVASKRKH